MNSAQSARGTQTSTTVPLPDSESRFNRPPSISARSLIDLRPTPSSRSPSPWPERVSSGPSRGSKPCPSSSTIPHSPASWTSMLTSTRPHPECSTALRTASLITRVRLIRDVRGDVRLVARYREYRLHALGNVGVQQLAKGCPNPSCVSHVPCRASCVERLRVCSRAVLVASVARFSLSAARVGSLFA